jgi:ferredoxin-like protein FixX
MVKLFIIIFGFLFTEIAYSQKVLPIEAYNLINYQFDGKIDFKIDVNLVTFKNEYLNISELFDSKLEGYIGIPLIDIDSLFNEETIHDLRINIRELATVTKLDKSKLKIRRQNIMIKDKRTESEKLFPKQKTYRICPPIFARNGQLALLYIENHCGIECGGGQINIYSKSAEGDWKYVFTIPMWVS